MPVEIREIVIQTEVRNDQTALNNSLSVDQLNHARKQILAECERMIKEKARKNRTKR